VTLVLLLPPQRLPELRVGQRVFLQPELGGERFSRTITQIVREIVSPDVARRVLGPAAQAGLTIEQPVALAFARFEPAPSSLDIASYAGSVYEVDVEIGSRRMLGLLPLVSQLFGV
jgi:hypothetical protein